MNYKIIIIMAFISTLLSSCGVESKVRKSLTPIRQEVKQIPKSYQIDFENISFQTKDGLSLKGWWIKGKNDITIILSHSFGSNRSGWEGSDAQGNSHKINWLPSIKVLVDAGYNVLAFDHRACGESEGDMTYFGKKEALDINAAINWVHTNNEKLTKFGIIGFSSGANATLRSILSLEEQNKYQLAGVAVNLYWYDRMIKKTMKFFANTPGFFLPIIKKATHNIVGFNPKEEINPSQIISKINSPILLVNAQFDEIADVQDIKDIYKKGMGHTQLQILKNETRFKAYHYIEKHPKDVITFINNNLKTTKMKTNNKSTILLIEFQKTWTEKGIFKKIINKEYTKRNVLENTKNLINNARKNNIQVIQAPLILDKKDKNYKKTPFPARLLKRFTKGTWKAEFTEGIFDTNDIVIKGRYGFDACQGSNLEQILIDNEIKTVYVCGFTTDHCIKETMNSLIEKGFDCVMVSDCTATKNNKLQKEIESEFTITDSKVLIKNLKRTY